ncbi:MULTISPECIES: NAD(P)-binding domain-containing protein [unclassified Francisella]|uniref:NAD(P)-binding domain-containing protein n=1 Tax=unclassified Francisella TaxID=2610885 RepID=UPI002E35D310|nr:MULTISPECIES: NAD(P)-binding domain-containing protein [unclassified Francisella]MED7820092.1 NAD(P)-binding domain-containing protein [Francisella sp. 19S2-4]MED7830912.1 NAD(P)-binding domain-containing protein [Francisella sp. 19S2-10]
MKKVAIIGAGASGLISAKVLLDKGFDVTVFEKTSNVAGVWNFSEQEGALYKSLRTNLPKEIMVFENEQVSYKADKSFINYNNVKTYLEANAKAWQVNKNVHLNCEVIKLEPIDKQSDQPAWQLAYIKGHQRFEEKFDFIIVCNGHFNTPKIPLGTDGLDSIKNCITHSKNYRSPSNHSKRVLCVGYSSSGMDIAQELLNSGREVYVSLRELDDKKEQYNLQNSNKGIKFISCIQKFEKTEYDCLAVTTNQNNIEIDEVIFCTGYKYDFPFLSQDIVSTKDNVVEPLYNQLLHEKYLNLAFVGLPWKTLPFVLSECQAIFLGSLWQQNKISMHKVIANMRDSKTHRSNYDNNSLKYYHMLDDKQLEYNLNLLDAVGQKTLLREKRMMLMDKVYKDVNNFKLQYPFSFREADYQVDFEKQKYERILNPE